MLLPVTPLSSPAARRPLRTVAVVASGLLLALGTGGSAAPREGRTGYLTPGEFDVTQVIEPAPRKGDPRYDTDRKIFRATRKLADTPRWQMATSDVDTSPPALMRDFSCAVGVALTPEDAPLTLRLVSRAGADTAAQTNIAKNVYRRARPFHQDKGRVCQPVAQLADSFDYPSGHTTWGWTWALILAELAPDRAGPILRRGRAYGDSRFVCGAHNESAVEGGMLSASATMALVRTKSAFQEDLAAARAEIARLRADPASPRPQGCTAEEALVAQRVMPKLDR
ncbi:phosphatase PAP2 family protein [Sphingomonas sp.]|uniref:acid phosphatase n=1 Tax=Sphingomonas sp. TaxID=28214 RepID=UPI0031DF0CE7